ncbi:MAG: peroxiredoxin family protein [SAR202 cluster bacterium]|nr:peroxiredoxin family protein [SAR202 cluster bacterium]
MSFKKLYGCINFSIVVLILLAMSVFSCTSENEIEDITTASKIVDEEIVAEQTINEIETADYVSESPSDLETDQAAGLIDSILVGTQVGNRIPEFKIIYEDGTEVTSTSLIENGKPVFMYFAASWCPGCTRELAELKEVYPEFTDDIVFISVGVDPTETMSELVKYKERHSHPWTVAKPLGQMIADLKVTSQSTKIAFNSAGVITYRDGYGKGNREVWAKWMENEGEGF